MLLPNAVRRFAGAVFAGSVVSSILAAGFLAAGVTAAPAAAADPRHLGTFKDWNAFLFEEKGQKVCYISSQPKKSEPKAKRGDIYTLVTHRPAEKALDVVSVIVGYPFKKGSEAEVSIDGKDFKLFTDGETAWARDADADRAVTSALRNGKQMVVKGVSGRGTKTTDTYSLAGVGQAYDAINEACGVKR
ncbi:invasion associated locus B family protein [Azospirillum sp. TSA6c]|uniref:invasion associated locus B family protein n=1 Tax=unclassified Azospirillum TaxID=2630922 RepID=UPI000D6486BD|nr:invasion associated locus B family protein [Azospirillum sp. TSA6c]